MINPWANFKQPGSLQVIPRGMQGMPRTNPVAMPQAPQEPLGSFRPRTSTFMPGTGTGAAHQAHPYLDTQEKQNQRKRDVMTPNYSFASEGAGR